MRRAEGVVSIEVWAELARYEDTITIIRPTDLVFLRAKVSSRVAQPGFPRVPCKDTVFQRAQISSGSRLCTS